MGGGAIVGNPNSTLNTACNGWRSKHLLRLLAMHLLSLVLTPLTLFAEATQAQLPQQAPKLVSPEVLGDNRVTFRVYAPNAKAVTFRLEGSPAVAMEKDGQGIWSVTTAALVPDFYGYSFRVDGTKFADPSNLLQWPSMVSGESEVHVPGPLALPWEVNAVPRGVLHHHFYYSAVVGDERDFYVYTPPNYNSRTARTYPTLYLLHGGGDDAKGWVSFGHANVILDNLIARGKIKPMIVVMPLGYGTSEILQRYDDVLERRNFDNFSRALLTEVVPQVEAAYPVAQSRSLRAIAGLSMGGDEALVTGLTHLDAFAWVGSFSGGLLDVSDLEPAGAAFAKLDRYLPGLGARANADIRLLWVTCGSGDEGSRPNRVFHEWLKSKGIAHNYSETAGKHTWMVWRRNLAELLPLLFQ